MHIFNFAKKTISMICTPNFTFFISSQKLFYLSNHMLFYRSDHRNYSIYLITKISLSIYPQKLFYLFDHNNYSIYLIKKMQLLPEKQSMMTSCVYESSMWLWLQIENCKQRTSCFFFLRNAALAVLVVGETSAFFRQATCSTKSTSSTSSADMLGQKLQEDQKLRSSKMELLQQLHFLASTLPT